jgi:hypothetical protein
MCRCHLLHVHKGQHTYIVLLLETVLFSYEACHVSTERLPSTKLLGPQSSLAETESTPANLDIASAMIFNTTNARQVVQASALISFQSSPHLSLAPVPVDARMLLKMCLGSPERVSLPSNLSPLDSRSSTGRITDL